MTVPNTISSNLISGHFPQFIVAPNILFNVSKSNNCERDCSRFDHENFVLNILVNLENLLFSSNTNTEKPHKSFYEKIESLLDTYLPLKKNSQNKI